MNDIMKSHDIGTRNKRCKLEINNNTNNIDLECEIINDNINDSSMNHLLDDTIESIYENTKEKYNSGDDGSDDDDDDDDDDSEDDDDDDDSEDDDDDSEDDDDDSEDDDA